MKSIRRQLITAFMVVNAFILFVGGIGYFSVDSVAESIAVFRNQTEEAALIREIANCVNQMEKAQKNLVIAGTENEITDFNTLFSKAQELQSRIVKSDKPRVEQMLLYLLKNSMQEYNSIFINEMVNVWKANQEVIQSQTSAALANGNGGSYANRDTDYLYQSAITSIYSRANSKKDTIAKTLTLLDGYFSARRDRVSAQVEAVSGVVRQYILIASILSLIAALVISIVYSRSLVVPIKAMVSLAGKVEKGILTEKFSVKRKDELGTLSLSINEMIGRISSLITEVKKAANLVESSLTGLNKATNTVLESSEQISSAIEQVTIGNSESAEGLSQINNNLKGIVDDINDIKHHIDTVLILSKEAGSVIESGVTLVRSTAEQISAAQGVFNETNQSVASLRNKSVEIHKILDMVRDIGERTNLLSLNASIEAARAGEYGRGFAVVADEIRKLAMQSDSSVSDIKAILDNVQNDIDSIAASMEKSNCQVEKGNCGMEQVSNNFEEISSALQKLNVSIGTIAEKIVAATGSSHEIFDSVSTVVAVAEQSTAAAEEITASTKEQIRLSEDSVGICADMGTKFDELKKLVAFFKTETEGNANA